MPTGSQKDRLLSFSPVQSVSSPHPSGSYCSQLLADSPTAWSVRLNMATLATLRGFFLHDPREVILSWLVDLSPFLWYCLVLVHSFECLFHLTEFLDSVLTKPSWIQPLQVSEDDLEYPVFPFCYFLGTLITGLHHYS